MSTGRLLVVAADADVRQSLVFALETEGFTVTPSAELPTRAWLRENKFDCTVLDQRVLRGEPYESVAFCIASHPVVLLAAKPFGWLLEWVSQVVETPVVEDRLLQAVHAASRPKPPATAGTPST